MWGDQQPPNVFRSDQISRSVVSDSLRPNVLLLNNFSNQRRICLILGLPLTGLRRKREAQHGDAKDNIMISPLSMKRLKYIISSNFSKAMQLLNVAVRIQMKFCLTLKYDTDFDSLT